MNKAEKQQSSQSFIHKRFPNMEDCASGCFSNSLNMLSQGESACIRQCVAIPKTKYLTHL